MLGEMVLSRSDSIRHSVKEWLKSGDHRISDELENLLQCSVNPETLKVFSRFIVERYKHGTLSVHFHIRESGLKVRHVCGQCERYSDPTEYCAVVQFLVSEEQSKFAGLRDDLSVVCNDGNDVQRAVFVDVVESVEGTQRAIPSVVRLQSLDQCRSLCGNTSQPFAGDLIGEIGSCVGDWELVAGGRTTSGSRLDQFPDDVIQDGLDVGEEVSCNCANLRRCAGEESHTLDEHPEFRIFLQRDAALSLSILPRSKDNFAQMFLCPDEFDLDCAEG